MLIGFAVKTKMYKIAKGLFGIKICVLHAYKKEI